VNNERNYLNLIDLDCQINLQFWFSLIFGAGCWISAKLTKSVIYSLQARSHHHDRDLKIQKLSAVPQAVLATRSLGAPLPNSSLHP
jgi:hypothetical protein